MMISVVEELATAVDIEHSSEFCCASSVESASDSVSDGTKKSFFYCDRATGSEIYCNAKYKSWCGIFSEGFQDIAVSGGPTPVVGRAGISGSLGYDE